MYTDEIVTKLVNEKDAEQLKEMYRNGKISHSEYKRARNRMNRVKDIDMSRQDYAETFAKLIKFYKIIATFGLIDIGLTAVLRIVMLNTEFRIILVIYSLFYIAFSIFIIRLIKKYNFNQYKYATKQLKRDTLKIPKLFYLQFIPIVGIVFEIILLYKVLNCLTMSNNIYKNQLDKRI